MGSVYTQACEDRSHFPDSVFDQGFVHPITVERGQ